MKQILFNDKKKIVFENIFILFALLTCQLSHSKLYILRILLPVAATYIQYLLARQGSTHWAGVSEWAVGRHSSVSDQRKRPHQLLKTWTILDDSANVKSFYKSDIRVYKNISNNPLCARKWPHELFKKRIILSDYVHVTSHCVQNFRFS